MSIFTKDCPQCTAPNPTSAVRCPCGHCFDPEAVTDKKAAVEVAIHEERLYHDYLAARVVQAEAEYEVARADALADPGDTYKAAQALAAEQALNSARAELRAQAQKTSQLKKLTARIAPAPRAAVPRVKPRAKSKHAGPARTPSKPIVIAKPVVLKPTVATPEVRKAPPVAEASKAAAATVTPPPSPKPAPVVARALPAAKPSRAFRARQAKQAEAIVLKAAAMPSAVTPQLQTVAPPPTKECPNCTSKVPATMPQCRCGFGFNAASMEMAALPLDAAALAILRR